MIDRRPNQFVIALACVDGRQEIISYHPSHIAFSIRIRFFDANRLFRFKLIIQNKSI